MNTNQNKLPIIMLVVAFAVIAYITLATKSTPATPVDVTPNLPSQGDQNDPLKVWPPMGTTTITGVFECLPHKNQEGPQTMECAYGFKDNYDRHFVVDMSRTDISSFDLPMDRRFSLTGNITPIEVLSTDMWQRYDVKGIISVTSYEEDTTDIPVITPDSKVILELKKPIIVNGTTIRADAVIEDSRCPSDVTCIQAGRAVVALTIDSPSGSSVMTIEPGKNITTETLTITLDDVTPYPVSTSKISDEQYRFAFTIQNKK